MIIKKRPLLSILIIAMLHGSVHAQAYWIQVFENDSTLALIEDYVPRHQFIDPAFSSGDVYFFDLSDGFSQYAYARSDLRLVDHVTILGGRNTYFLPAEVGEILKPADMDRDAAENIRPSAVIGTIPNGESFYVYFSHDATDEIIAPIDQIGWIQFERKQNDIEILSSSTTSANSVTHPGITVGQGRQPCITPENNLAGDLDNDGTVAFSDFLVVSDYFGQLGYTTYELGDIDCDGIVNFADFLVLQDNYGKTFSEQVSSAPSAAVPEPSGFCLLAMGMLLLRRRRKGR